MVKYHIDNNLTDCVKDSSRFQDLTEEDHSRLYSEIKNATLQGLQDILVSKVADNIKSDNKVNSLLLWVLGITDKYPDGPQSIKNPGSMMDIDLDFSKENRDKVYTYLEEKYGKARVVHVATFGTMGAKGAVRNAARALEYPVEVGNRLSKFIPNDPLITINSAMDNNSEFKADYESNPDTKKIIDVALKLEGLPNSIGSHASACVISDINIDSDIPLMISTKKDKSQIMTQFEYKDVENCFFVKFDILGLETLDILDLTVKTIKKYKGIDINLNSIDVNDEGIYKLLNDGNVTNVFQFDGSVQAFLPRIKPENIDEVSAITAICRPGPLSLGLHEKYAEAKFEGKKFDYGIKDQKLLDKVWDICSVSYGLMVFQEEMINCFKDIAGFNDTLSEKARKATGKKDPVLLASLEEKFIEGGVKNGYSEECLKQLFDSFKGFSAYSFNAGHSYAYSIITCQAAYLSYYYPLEFFQASLTVCSDNTDKVRHFIKAVKDRGYKILPPNINKSKDSFIIDGDSIVFGLNAIKGVGAALTKKILKTRPKKGYKSFGEFVVKNKEFINKSVLEAYTKAGCFSDFHNKTTLLNSIEPLLEFSSIIKETDRLTIFDLSKDVSLSEYIDNIIIEERVGEDKPFYEIDSMGLYITKHPMEDYIVDSNKAIDISNLFDYDDGTRVVTVGAISGIEIKKTKAKTNMALFNLDSHVSSIKCLCFSSSYAKFMNLIKEGALIQVSGILKVTEMDTELMINDISDTPKALCRIQKKKISDPIFTELTEESFTENSICYTLNNKFKFKLEKKLDVL